VDSHGGLSLVRVECGTHRSGWKLRGHSVGWPAGRDCRNGIRSGRRVGGGDGCVAGHARGRRSLPRTRGRWVVSCRNGTLVN